MTSRPSTAAPILAVLAIVIALPLLYAGAYFVRAERSGIATLCRGWSGYLESRVFWPAMLAEGVLRRTTLISQYPKPPPNGGDAICTELVYSVRP